MLPAQLDEGPPLAEDLLSETFLQAIRSAGSFKGESSVRTWLCGIARHLWLRQLRSKQEFLEYDDRLVCFADGDLGDRLAEEQTVSRIKELLLQKDERSRKVIQMRLEFYAYSEIAERLGISESSARVIEFRARKWLKEILEKEGLLG